MPTLSELRASGAPARSMKQGTIQRSLGAKTVTPTTVAKPKLGALGMIVDKAASLGNDFAGLAGQGALAAAKFAVNRTIDVGKAAYRSIESLSSAGAMKGQIKNDLLTANSLVLDEKQKKIRESYVKGELSRENYAEALRGIAGSQQDISRGAQDLQRWADPYGRALDIADMATTVLSAGSWQLAKGGSKELAEKGFQTFFKDNANFVENVIAKSNPAAKALLERNAAQLLKRESQKLAGETTAQWLKREAKPILTGIFIKQPIFYHQNAKDAVKTYAGIAEGDYPAALRSAAWIGLQSIKGGPIGGFFALTKSGSTKLGKLAYGKASFIDSVGQRLGIDIAQDLAKTTDPAELARRETLWRIYQEGNLRATNGDAALAADNFLSTFVQSGDEFKEMDTAQIIKHIETVTENHRKADELINSWAKKGIIPGITREEALKLTPVRIDANSRNGLAARARGLSTDMEERLNWLNTQANQPGATWANNEPYMRKLEEILNKEQTGKDIERAIKAIDAAELSVGLPKAMAAKLGKLGYVVGMPKSGRTVPFLEADDVPKLISKVSRGNPELFDEVIESEPTLATLARWAEVAGISPRAANNVANRKLSENVVASLEGSEVARSLNLTTGKGNDIVTGGQAVLSKLEMYVENKKPSLIGSVIGGTITSPRAAITDIRQLTPWEIKDALKLKNISEAREVSKAVMRGYLDTPMEFRGLGDKVVDALYAVNPLHKYYSRIQSALKYAYNPFFRTQEKVETKLLSKISASNLLWLKPKAVLDDTVLKLENAGLFSSSMAGEAAQDLVLGRLTANITKGQKRDLAGLALSIAERKGQTLDDLLRTNPDEITDALRVIVQYPNKGVLNSSLARTMNLAFFPMRYNLKVTKIAAEVLGKQPPAIQKAVLQSMFKMKDWLKSDEGIRWQSEYADAIQLLKWVTPVNSIAYTMNLLGHKPDSIGELGLLGGLPLGFISQILDSQGVINLNTPYVDPKTGDVFPKYIPQTTKARAATAIGDLLGTMFNYPGRTLGLPGKHATIRNIVRNFIETNGQDFDKRLDTERLTPLQQQWVRVLKGDTSDEAIDSLYNLPADGEFNWFTMPPNTLPFVKSPLQEAPRVSRRTNLPTKAQKSKEAKKKNVSLPM